MSLLKSALAALLLLSSAAALAEPASEASIRQLLDVTQAQKLVDGMRDQVSATINNSMSQEIQQSLHGATPTPRQEQAIANMKSRMVDLIQGALTWKKLEPRYMSLYRDTFSEEEVEGMLAFYRTPAGQAVINKMPVLAQKTVQETQKMISDMTPQLQQIMEQYVTEMESEDK